MATKNYIIGALILTVLLGSIYITLPGKVKIQVYPTYTKYFVWEPTILKPNGTWVTGATEYIYLYNGTKKLLATSRIVSNYTTGNLTTMFRRVDYVDGIYIQHNYTFDGTVTDVNRVPISEQLECINCEGYTIQYEIKSLAYSDGTRAATSPELFGHNMKVEWEPGSTYSKITQLINNLGKLVIKYKPLSDYEIYDVKVSDPTTFPAVSQITTYYNFSVGSGYVMGNGTDAMKNNNASLSNGAYTCPGYLGGGLCLDGVNDWFNISNFNFFTDDNQNNYTINMMLKVGTIRTNANDRFFFAKNSSSSNVVDYFVGNARNGTSFTIMGGTTQLTNWSTDALHEDTWYMITTRYNGTRTYLYVNGVKVNSSEESGIASVTHPLFNVVNISLGRPDSNGLNGTIDEFMYLKVPLNDTAIYGLFLNYSAGYSPFNETIPEVIEYPTIYDERWNVVTIEQYEVAEANVNVTHSTGDIDVVKIEVQYPNGTRKNHTAVRRYV